jgi:hypothetical protein
MGNPTPVDIIRLAAESGYDLAESLCSISRRCQYDAEHAARLSVTMAIESSASADQAEASIRGDIAAEYAALGASHQRLSELWGRLCPLVRAKGHAAVSVDPDAG